MKKIPFLIAAVLVLSTISWFVFGGKTTLAPADKADTSQDEANTKRIKISNMTFSPQSTTVTAGTTVRWVNDDSTEHAIATEDGAGAPESFDSANIPKGAAYTLKLSKPGTYKYYCKFHPNMKGEIIVN